MKHLFVVLAVAVTAAWPGAAGAAGGKVMLAQSQTPEVCTEIYQPVCGTKDGKRVTYPNACFARAANATNVTPGECPK